MQSGIFRSITRVSGNLVDERDESPTVMQKAMLSRIRLTVITGSLTTCFRGSEDGAVAAKLRVQLDRTELSSSARSSAPCVLQITGRAGYARHPSVVRSAHFDPPVLAKGGGTERS
jgi:hypothetical protein